MRAYIAIALSICINACQSGRTLPLSGFDKAAFVQDRSGCTNQRIQFLDIIKKQKKVILGASERDIFITFGRYDYQILDRRNQKKFIYFFEKGSHCEQIQNSTKAKAMVISFNSVSLVFEVEFTRGHP